MVLAILQLIDQGNYHDAGHVLLNIGRSSTRFLELASLRPALLTLAGEQALSQGKLECAETFWQPLMAEQPFNPQLAVNLLKVLELNESDQERQRLLTRLLNWLEQEAKQHPQDWTDERLLPTMAHLHCRLADTWMALGRYRTAMGSLQQAQRVCPESPEVLGRRGLVAASEDKYQEATALLTQALEGGCRYEEVYYGLLKCWKELENPQALNETRRRFGKYFDDLGAESEIVVSPWVDALSTRSYPLFSRLVQTKEQKDAALRACRIFVDAVQGVPNSGGRVSLQQSEAVRQWDALLEKLSAVEQISVLQAIALSIQLFAKREKGIAATINQYLQKLFQLTAQHPEAREAHLVVLAVKESNSQKLQTPLRLYLDTMPQPGNALASLQLQVRRFAWTRSLIPFLGEALEREPHNPLLLLAKATTYPTMHPQYEEFRQQGFELARRLQDAKALQAFREEQAFINAQQVKEILPDPEEFDNFDLEDIEGLLEATIRKMLGNQIPQAELERMLPELKQRMFDNMLDFDDENDQPEFGRVPVGSGKPKKRKRGFQDL
jgi:tetratricopeptide (TPR) repeat protein